MNVYTKGLLKAAPMPGVENHSNDEDEEDEKEKVVLKFRGKINWKRNYPVKSPTSEDGSEKPVNLSRERALLQELSNANARLLQLERTIKWWSECTATWREKWGRVRIQRNELRDECKVLKGRNDALIMEFQKLQNQNEMFWSEIEKLRLEKRTAVVGPLIDDKKECLPKHSNLTEDVTIVDIPQNNALVKRNRLGHSHSSNDFIHKNEEQLVPRNYNKNFSFPGFLQDMIFIENLLAGDDVEQVSPCSSTSRGKTDHVTNAIIVEKLSKLKDYVKSCEVYVASKDREAELLKENVLQLQTMKSDIMRKYDELKQQNLVELNGEVRNGQTPAEKKIRELHAEIERLQEENCKEWTKREKCETDMAESKRELRLINQSRKELEEELAKRNEELRSSHSTGRTLLNEELDAKSKELIEIKQMYNKARRQLLEKTDELVHEKKRTEHLDGEVKRLRTRIDELKEELLQAEENIDIKGNELRRLQRSLEEQVGQTETLQAELKHATLRFKRQSMILNCQSEESISDES